MTEKQGGSDVRANTTTARPLNGGGPGGEYEITGHKWFFSAPMCDAFLVLAQADGGLSCFLLPRFTPDGERNRIHLQRLKDKLGNRSNASSEVEFRGAWARLVGEEGRGVPTIIEMVNHTRLDCAIGVRRRVRAGAPRAAIHHCTHRSGFGKRLVEQPLMQNVLADLAIESEAATVARDAARARLRRGARRRRRRGRVPAARDAGAQVLDLQARPGPRGRGAGVPGRQRLRRGVGDAAALPREPAGLDLGGVGQRPVPRRAARDGEAAPPRWRRSSPRSRRPAAPSPRVDAAVAALRDELADLEAIEARARSVVERMALALQGSLLVRYGDPAVADAFCASRLGGRRGPAPSAPCRRAPTSAASSSATAPASERSRRQRP